MTRTPISELLVQLIVTKGIAAAINVIVIVRAVVHSQQGGAVGPENALATPAAAPAPMDQEVIVAALIPTARCRVGEDTLETEYV